MEIIRTEKLTKIYKTGELETVALDNVSVEIETREFVAIMGPSGCGKSTLLHLMGGLDTPTSGTVFINGQSLQALNDDKLTELRRREIGFVFQFFNLIPVLTAAENAALPLRLDGVSAKEANAKAVTWLERFELGDKLSNRPDQLSGGQQQRVAVARALISEPTLILADEPTGNLDTKSAEEIAGLLSHVSKEWGRTVVMVTHDPRIAAYADRIIFLKDGRIVDETTLDASEEPVADKLVQYER